MSAPRRLIAIVNAAAGDEDKRELAGGLMPVFAEHGFDARLVLAGDGGEIDSAARDAVREKPDIIVAGGGDGTINAIVSRVAGTGIALGVLPLGTLNHFAKALRLPLDPRLAAAVVATGKAAVVDIGEVNGKIFVNNSSLGLYPRLVRRREEQQEQLGRGKWPAALWAAITLLRRHPLLDVRLTVNGQCINRRAAVVFIGNNVYSMSGLSIGERERLDCGQLSLFVTHRNGRSGLLTLAVRALFGRLRGAAGLDALVTEAVDIESRHKRLPVSIDGEVVNLDAPLSYRIRPRALTVIVGAAPAGSA
ncbi:MAG TPA: diacylglycerol kinase family protein [Rudaea sp.]|jgi:diacylglycerol kinase family enzyme|nr:diacylglycerol kinase family protein [Rudaea sp.]